MDYSYFKVKMLIVFVVTLVWGPRAGLAFVLLAMVYEPLIESVEENMRQLKYQHGNYLDYDADSGDYYEDTVVEDHVVYHKFSDFDVDDELRSACVIS
jgi:hypothetical protein